MVDDPKARIGTIASIQTFGSYAANFHPHVHALITEGAFHPAAGGGGGFERVQWWDMKSLTELFWRMVLCSLREARRLRGATEEMLVWYRAEASGQAPADGPFPAILYATSVSSHPFENVVLFETLAQQGYVVVAVPSVGQFQTRQDRGARPPAPPRLAHPVFRPGRRLGIDRRLHDVGPDVSFFPGSVDLGMNPGEGDGVEIQETIMPASDFTHLECSETGQSYAKDRPHNLSDAGKPLLARYNLDTKGRR